jgi:predicted oxidoreductase
VDADVIVIGAGLAGLVATAELAAAGRKVIVLDQEPEASLGGQAFWSFGGLFLVNSAEQRRLRIRDCQELALADWLGSAAFDRDEDHWPRRWAEAYVDFASGEKRSWLAAMGMKWFPVVQWAERGGYLTGTGGAHGNSVPRFHVTWGTGPGVVEPFERRVREAVSQGLVELRFRHRVTALDAAGVVSGEILEPSRAGRGEESSRTVVGDFSLTAQAVIVTSGGIGGNHDLVRQNWPADWGTPPARMLSGVPHHVDGLMIGVAQQAGAHVINTDRMWHYPEGVADWSPIWPRHGIRILSGPSPLWLDAHGQRLPAPLFPGFDGLGALRHVTSGGFDHSWFLLDRETIATEFALSGSEQNPDLTGKDVRAVLGRARGGPTRPVQAFLDKGADFIVRDSLPDLVRAMNDLVGADLIEASALVDAVRQRDLQVASGLGKDPQVVATSAARRYVGDRLTRIVKPHRYLDRSGGPLIAVRLHVLTRKTLGGLETDLSARVLKSDGSPLPGVFAAGEAAGFGGGGVHGYRALEGTFLGGCLFSGRVAGRAAAGALS